MACYSWPPDLQAPYELETKEVAYFDPKDWVDHESEADSKPDCKAPLSNPSCESISLCFSSDRKAMTMSGITLRWLPMVSRVDDVGVVLPVGI